MPAMFVLNGEVELTGVGGVRRVNINDFYTGYRTNVMRTEELITGVVIPLPKAGEHFKIYKVSKRKDLDLSTFMAAIWMKAAGGVIADARIAFGGVAATIVRMPRTEGALIGQKMSEATFRAAGLVARGEIQPISDVRGAADYRLQLAENIFPKFYADVGPQGAVNGDAVVNGVTG
jgi:xanthine dehydrogenase small subunit